MVPFTDGKGRCLVMSIQHMNMEARKWLTRSEDILQSLRCTKAESWQAAAEEAWPLLCEVRNAPEAEKAAKQELACVRRDCSNALIWQANEINERMPQGHFSEPGG